jgi:hypothetical protein
VRVAGAKDFSQAVEQALPAPKPLIGIQEDTEWDRSQWW